jgi:acetylornithine deacetylase/succinyl-diaminopimelate desuccinylase-like protein
MGDVEEDVTTFCSDLIRIDTQNFGGGNGKERPAAEYVAGILAGLGIEPEILESAPGRTNVVARIAGREADLPALLVHGHLDTVPANPDEWTRHPLSGEVVDGVVWGRGAVDMKNTVAMVLAWARQGLTPRRDVVLAFTADEEDTADFGAGFLAAKHADLFEGCTEAIGESGGYAFHQSGVRLYPVAAGERGTAWIRLIARGTAGHGSRINRDNAVAKLAAAVTRIAEHEWPVHQIPTARAAISALTRALGGEDHGGATALYAATLRNSANPTMLQAGYKVNVIPGEARASVDGRVLPGHLEEFETTMADLVGADVTWEYEHREVPLEAPIDAPIFQAMTDALLAVDPGGHVVPYCMAGGTDAKQFSRLGIAGYGFAPLGLPPGYDYSAMFHGVDERVPVAALTFGVDVLGWFLNDY